MCVGGSRSGSNWLPQTYQESVATQEHRKEQWSKVQEMKAKKIMEKQEVVGYNIMLKNITCTHLICFT